MTSSEIKRTITQNKDYFIHLEFTYNDNRKKQQLYIKVICKNSYESWGTNLTGCSDEMYTSYRRKATPEEIHRHIHHEYTVGDMIFNTWKIVVDDEQGICVLQLEMGPYDDIKLTKFKEDPFLNKIIG